MSFNDNTYDDFSLRTCSECGSEFTYKGLGEYECTGCGRICYNDYGKVRNFLEGHPGATSDEVSKATGVSRSKIRTMLVEEKFELSKESYLELTCESCGISIRSGRYCEKCQAKMENETKNKRHLSNISGGFLSESRKAATGQKRFERENR